MALALGDPADNSDREVIPTWIGSLTRSAMSGALRGAGAAGCTQLVFSREGGDQRPIKDDAAASEHARIRETRHERTLTRKSSDLRVRIKCR